MNSDIDQDVYVEGPPGWAECGVKLTPNQVTKLLKGLYGLKQSPRLWQNKLRNCLAELGFKPLLTDQGVYINPSNNTIIVTYVDDMLIIGKDVEYIRQLKLDLNGKFDTEDLGHAAYFLGVRITRDRKARTISLCQDAYIRAILKRFGMEECFPIRTPMKQSMEQHMIPNTETATNAEIGTFQSIIGSIMYLAVNTRHDITYIVSILSQFLNNPSEQHLVAAYDVLRYLSGTIFLSTVYGGGPPGDEDMSLVGFSDSDWGGDSITKRSRSG